MDRDENLFEGAPEVLLDSYPRGTGRYVLDTGAATRVRHLTGYGTFVRFVRQQGGSAAVLAGDTLGLVAFARQHRVALLADADLLAAGSVFFGNTLTRRAPAAVWEWPAEQPMEVRQRYAGPSFPVERVFPAILNADSGRLAELEEVLLQWDETEAVGRDAQRRLAIPAELRWAAVPFSLPSEPLAAATRARMLADYLLQHYVARVEEDSAFAATFPHPPADVRRVMRLTSGPDSAPLTIALTAFGVVVHAGALHDFEYPDRRGDAWQHLSDVVLAVAAGAYREAYPIGRRRFAGFAIATRDGSGEGSQGPVADVDPALLETAATRLAELADGWQPWRLREEIN